MVLDQEDNTVLGVKFDNRCSQEECSDVAGKISKSEKGSEDIVHVLPNDPFGMEFSNGLTIGSIGMDVNFSLPKDPFGMNFGIETTVSTFNDSIEDFGLKTCALEIHEEGNKDDDEKLIGELNLVWASSMQFELEEGENENVDGNEADSVIHAMDESTLDECNLMVGNAEELMCFGFEKYQKEHVKDSCSEAEAGAPPDALFFALGYLGVWDLLSVERVCKSLRDAVQNDPLLWRKIQIDYPLSFSIFDDFLLRLTNRAQGSLHSLSLINCKEITNIGLKHVLESNLRLTKLSVCGCTNLNVDSTLQDLRIFNSLGMPGIKHLRISDHSGIMNHHLTEFKLLLGLENEKMAGSYKPRFYREGQRYLSLDDERAIDIELCPRCHQVRQVYDCPLKSCQAKPDSTQACKACIACVDRCIKCGCCLDNTDYEETFCLDLVCLDCLTQLLDCQGRMRFLPTHTYFDRKTESESAGKSDSCEGCPNQEACASAPKGTDPDLVSIAERMATVQHKILVLSGKGGVVKSTFSAQLSFALAAKDYQVGLLDIDICGPSTPKMLGLEGQQIHQSNLGWSPVYVESNLGVMSVGFMLPNPDEAVIWRGPRKNGLIKQFLKDVYWGELDFLVVDAPPGTSDEHISVVQFLKATGIDGAIIVTTPQQVSLIDVRKEVSFCRKVELPILGVVENMSGLCQPLSDFRFVSLTDAGEQKDMTEWAIMYLKEKAPEMLNLFAFSEVFDRSAGGGTKMCRDMGVSFLGKVPLDPQLCKASEEGRSCFDDGKCQVSAPALKAIVEKVLSELEVSRMEDVA